MADLWNQAKTKAGTDAWRAALKAAGWTKERPEDIELLLTRCHMASLLRPDDKALLEFIVQSEQEIVSACSFVTPETKLESHEIFLRRIGRRPARLPRTQLYTTNYDLAFETAASNTGFALIDGFSHTSPQRFDGSYFDYDLAIRDRDRAAAALDWAPNVLHLLKMHGSIDWTASGTSIVRDADAERPLIVYPRSSKFELSYQQPFLELMARFQSSLRAPDTALLVIGSGLTDTHLSEPLMAAIRSNARLSVLVVSPGLASKMHPVIDALKGFIARGDRRLTLLAATFDEFVDCLPELVADSEAELHQARMET
jgi:hypothetical protein